MDGSTAYKSAASAFETALRRIVLGLKYAESQPRVPAGSPEGGQWTSGNYNGLQIAGTPMAGTPWECEFVSTYVLRCRDEFGFPDFDIDFSGHGGVHWRPWDFVNGSKQRRKFHKF